MMATDQDWTHHEDFVRFIEFGRIFDRQARDFLVHYILARLQKTPLPPDYTGSPYFSYFRQSLDQVLNHEPLLKAAFGNARLTREIVHDILKWIKKIDQKIQEDNPYYPEWQRLQGWAVRPTFVWKETWTQALAFLSGTYTRQEIDVDFYKEKFRQLMPSAPADAEAQKIADRDPLKSPIDILIDDLLAQWDALLSAKILTYEAEQLQQAGGEFEQLLHAKVEELVKLMDLVQPFATEAGRFWDMSRGLWKHASFDILEQYGVLLKHEKPIQELADMLGRMREAAIEMEEEIYEEVVTKKAWVPDDTLKEEVTGLAGSNDLNRVLPAEIAFLAEGATESLFFQKYADQSLLSFRYQGKKLVTSDQVNFYSTQKQKKKEKGPFILCIDTSGSMFGKPAQIAKVLCFAVMKMAARDDRKCYLINFSIGIKTLKLSDVANNLDQIAAFLSMSFDGGTDVTPALSEALDMLNTNDYKDADVLMVSDFVMFRIRDAITERIRREQHKGTRFHSLTLSTKSNVEVLENFDNCWVYDPDQKTIMRQLLEDLRAIEQAGE